MTDLHKYLIGTAAGVILCLLIWGGYSMFSGSRAEKNVFARGAAPAAAGMDGTGAGVPGVLGDADNLLLEENAGELTAEQQERLLSAQLANESLAKKYSGLPSSETTAQPPASADSSNRFAGSFMEGGDALALNRSIAERSAQDSGNQQADLKRMQTRDAIVQGKSAAQKNQLANTIAAFENASELMPDDRDFQAASYQDMAASLFLLSKTAQDAQIAQTARDEAERYIKKSLAARNNTDARGLYANIMEEQRKTADAKRQRDMLAQQEADDRARQEEQNERQKRQVVELIGQGKNAAERRQLSAAVLLFDRASAAMPDIQQFANDSYRDMAESMLTLANRVAQPSDVPTALDRAETYIKQALAVQNSTAGRNLYARILDARKEYTAAQERLAAQQRQQEQAAAQARADAQRKEQEQLAQKRAEEQRKTQEAAAAQKQIEDRRKQQEQVARAAAQRKEQEQAAQKRAEEQRKAQAAAAQKKEAEQQIAQSQAAVQRRQQEQASTQPQRGSQTNQTNAQQAAATAAAQPQRAAQTARSAAKTPAQRQVENLITQGSAAAKRKQLNNAVLAFDRAGRLMPKDNDFAAESYRTMAESLVGFAENSTNKQAQQNALKKADEYIRKSLAAKDDSAAQALAAKIASVQNAAQTSTPQQNAQVSAPQNAAAPGRGRTAAKPAANARTAGTSATQGASDAGAAKESQADGQNKKREVDSLVQQGKKAGISGSFTEAQASFSKAAARMPANDAAFAATQYRDMAAAMQDLAQKDAAHKTSALNGADDYIKKSLAANNSDAQAHFIAAQVADAQNNAALAVQELEAASRLDRQNYLYSYELGRKYFEQKKYPQARSAFEQTVKANPNYEAGYFNLGITHKIMNANDAALTAFTKAASLKPGYVRAWIEIARVQDKQRKYTDSIANYQKALAIEPANLSALKEMAQVYAKSKDSKQAERYFKEALTLGDTDPVTYYNLAAVQLDAGKPADALQNAEKAIAGNNRDARFLYTYGLALEKNNRLKDAEDYYARAAAADGKYSKPRINLGRLQLEEGKLDSAEQNLLAAYQEESSNFEVNMNLGKLYGLKSQYGKAIDYYSNAIKIMPKDMEARQNLAAVYMSAGLKENARDTYQAIIKMNAQAWDSYYELGKVYISMDNKAEAKAIFEQLLRQRPNYRAAAEIRKLLGNL